MRLALSISGHKSRPPPPRRSELHPSSCSVGSRRSTGSKRSIISFCSSRSISSCRSTKSNSAIIDFRKSREHCTDAIDTPLPLSPFEKDLVAEVEEMARNARFEDIEAPPDESGIGYLSNQPPVQHQSSDVGEEDQCLKEMARNAAHAKSFEDIEAPPDESGLGYLSNQPPVQHQSSCVGEEEQCWNVGEEDQCWNVGEEEDQCSIAVEEDQPTCPLPDFFENPCSCLIDVILAMDTDSTSSVCSSGSFTSNTS